MSSILKRRSAAKSSLKSSNGSSTRVDCQPDERDSVFTPGRSSAFLRPQRPQSAGSGEGGRVSSWSQIYSRVDPGEFVTGTMNDRRRSLSGVVFTPPFSALRRFSRVSTSTGSGGGGGGPADPGMGVGGIDRSSSPSPPTQQHQPPQPTRLHTVPFSGAQEEIGHHDPPAHDHGSNGTPQIDGEPTNDGLGFRYNATPSPPLLSARQGQQPSPHQEPPVVPLMSAPMAVSHPSYVFSVTPPTFDRRNETYHRDAEYRKVAKKEGKLQNQTLGRNNEGRAALPPGRYDEGHILQLVLTAILVVILSSVTQQTMMASGPSAATAVATTTTTTTTTESLASSLAKCATYASLASLTFATSLAAIVMAMGATTTTTQLGRRGSSLPYQHADPQMQQQPCRQRDEAFPSYGQNGLIKLCSFLIAQGAFLQLVSLLAHAIDIGGASGKVVVLCVAGCVFASFGALHRKAGGTPVEARPHDQLLWHPTPHRAAGVEQQQQRPGFTRGSTWSHPHRGGGGGDWDGMVGGGVSGGGAHAVPNHLRLP